MLRESQDDKLLSIANVIPNRCPSRPAMIKTRDLRMPPISDPHP